MSKPTELDALCDINYQSKLREALVKDKSPHDITYWERVFSDELTRAEKAAALKQK